MWLEMSRDNPPWRAEREAGNEAGQAYAVGDPCLFSLRGHPGPVSQCPWDKPINIYYLLGSTTGQVTENYSLHVTGVWTYIWRLQDILNNWLIASWGAIFKIKGEFSAFRSHYCAPHIWQMLGESSWRETISSGFFLLLWVVTCFEMGLIC